MSEREQVQKIVDTMTDYQITGLLGFLRVFMPNQETLKAMDSAENDEDIYGPFDSVAEMMEALDA